MAGSNAGNNAANPEQQELVITRVFDAPRELVFEAFTRPEHVMHWWGRHSSSLPACEIDLRPGSVWRFVVPGPDSSDYAFAGTYREIEPPTCLVYTQIFEQFPDNEAVEMLNFAEQEGKTTVTATITYESVEVRDAVLQSGMETGAAESYDRLAEHLETMAGISNR